MVVVPAGVLPQVGQRGLVDERGEGEPIFVLLEVGSRRWSEVVDEEGDGREEVDLQADDDDNDDVDDDDLQADDDQHPLEVEVVEGGLAALLQHPLVLAAKKKVKKRRSSHLAEGKGVKMHNVDHHLHLFLLPTPSEAAEVGSQADLENQNAKSKTNVIRTYQSKDREDGEVRKDGIAGSKGPQIISKGLLAFAKEGNRRFWAIFQSCVKESIM